MPLANLIEPYASKDDLLLALCIWREARGEPFEAKVGVLNVVKNRCAASPKQGFAPSIRGNVLKPWAFSSFMQGDPNSSKYPGGNDLSWKDSKKVVNDDASRTPEDRAPDNVNGAVFYYSSPLHAPPTVWGPVDFCAAIGGLHFYKAKETQ